MGWFFWFKLHMIINDVGQIIAIKVIKNNTDNRIATELTEELKGYIYIDKLYITAKLFNFYTKNVRNL